MRTRTRYCDKQVQSRFCEWLEIHSLSVYSLSKATGIYRSRLYDLMEKGLFSEELIELLYDRTSINIEWLLYGELPIDYGLLSAGVDTELADIFGMDTAECRELLSVLDKYCRFLIGMEGGDS